MDWLLGTKPASLTLTLQAQGSATNLPGFGKGPLSLTCKYGETVQAVLDRFNTYRGPDNQISELFFASGERLPLAFVLKENIIAYIRPSV